MEKSNVRDWKDVDADEQEYLDALKDEMNRRIELNERRATDEVPCE